uniref:Uncharacterized protein n=1 Tax=Romanomermis culicivorax TaxID=13658 RepID=A0A915JXX3_ROMCU
MTLKTNEIQLQKFRTDDEVQENSPLIVLIKYESTGTEKPWYAQCDKLLDHALHDSEKANPAIIPAGLDSVNAVTLTPTNALTTLST